MFAQFIPVLRKTARLVAVAMGRLQNCLFCVRSYGFTEAMIVKFHMDIHRVREISRYDCEGKGLKMREVNDRPINNKRFLPICHAALCCMNSEVFVCAEALCAAPFFTHVVTPDIPLIGPTYEPIACRNWLHSRRSVIMGHVWKTHTD